MASEGKAAAAGIPLADFPAGVRATLATFDANGDGVVSTAELVRAAELYADARRSAGRVLRLSIALTVAVCALLGAIAGIVYGVVRHTEETRVGEDGVQRDKDTGVPVSTNNNRVRVPVGALPYLPAEASLELDKVSLSREATGAVLKRHVDQVDYEEGARVVIRTTAGDVVDVRHGQKNVTVTLAGEEAHSRNGVCDSCQSANVVVTPEMSAGLQQYVDMISAGTGRRQLKYDPTDTSIWFDDDDDEDKQRPAAVRLPRIIVQAVRDLDLVNECEGGHAQAMQEASGGNEEVTPEAGLGTVPRPAFPDLVADITGLTVVNATGTRQMPCRDPGSVGCRPEDMTYV